MCLQAKGGTAAQNQQITQNMRSNMPIQVNFLRPAGANTSSETVRGFLPSTVFLSLCSCCFMTTMVTNNYLLTKEKK